MVLGHPTRQFLALLALSGWIGFAGGGDAAKLLAQALGFHGDCHMPCCREQANAACPRMRGPASDASGSPEGGHSHHAGHAVARNEASAPASPLSLSSRSTCEEQCATLAGLHRSALKVEGTANPTPPANETAPRTISAERPSVRFLRDVPSRAPPA
jgi:hypothetical protein